MQIMALICKIKLGDKHFRIQHIKIVLRRLVTSFYLEMPSTACTTHFSGNLVWTMRIIGVIRSHGGSFFQMVTHVFDNSNLSQEIFATDTWGAVICSLGHGRKLKAWSLHSRKDRKHVLAAMSQRAYYSSPGVNCKNLL